MTEIHYDSIDSFVESLRVHEPEHCFSYAHPTPYPEIIDHWTLSFVDSNKTLHRYSRQMQHEAQYSIESFPFLEALATTNTTLAEGRIESLDNQLKFYFEHAVYNAPDDHDLFLHHEYAVKPWLATVQKLSAPVSYQTRLTANGIDVEVIASAVILATKLYGEDTRILENLQ